MEEETTVECPNCCGNGNFGWNSWGTADICELCGGSGRLPADWNAEGGTDGED